MSRQCDDFKCVFELVVYLSLLLQNTVLDVKNWSEIRALYHLHSSSVCYGNHMHDSNIGTAFPRFPCIVV